MTQGLRPALRALLGLSPARDAMDHATFQRPDHGAPPYPAVLYCHAHGGEYALGRKELTDGARWLSAPFAPDLLAAGYAVLCVDMPGFGDRQVEGSESALAKAGLWQGRPLFGQMLAAQVAALDWLCRHKDIDAGRITTLGTSMGAALAMWVAALEPRVHSCVQLCMFANISPLIASGVHDRHGPYLTVPGLLPLADIGDVAALIAPRPQFVGLGADDVFTPPEAREPALASLRAAYHGSDALHVHIAPGSGHLETAQMRREILCFLASGHPVPAMEDEKC